jgi:hypothetical protein
MPISSGYPSAPPAAAALAGLCLAALAGCAHQQAENPALSQYPGIQAQIESFYNNNATEDDWTCNEVEMQNIDKSQVVSQSPTQVRVAATYYFTSFDESPGQGGDQCQGFNTRFFTFDKGPGGQLSLMSMSGAQRGVSG